ncbi:hypothetical protein I4F81_002184 [Pyropia yezoensis]|uniref:Uncharacterized protein n=1 Tax=Pyropia yezoensis TaxID=2788 RepID=A0ACC3BNT0_PYRYE|nr:hypothetical protein I4F81_002184 [Neopyropia yezoensis]
MGVPAGRGIGQGSALPCPMGVPTGRGIPPPALFSFLPRLSACPSHPPPLTSPPFAHSHAPLVSFGGATEVDVCTVHVNDDVEVGAQLLRAAHVIDPALTRPVTNVRPGTAYPPVLLTAGLNDPRVGYWEAAKMAAHLATSPTPPPASAAATAATAASTAWAAPTTRKAAAVGGGGGVYAGGVVALRRLFRRATGRKLAEQKRKKEEKVQGQGKRKRETAPSSPPDTRRHHGRACGRLAAGPPPTRPLIPPGKEAPSHDGSVTTPRQRDSRGASTESTGRSRGEQSTVLYVHIVQ